MSKRVGVGTILSRLPRTVWLVGLISLLNDAASDLVYPLLPLYLAAVIGTGPRTLGLIEGLAEAAASVLKLVSGVLADRSRRTKPWIVAGYGLAGLSRPLFALAASWPVVLVLRLTDRVGKGLRSAPRDLLLAGSVSSASRGLAFGIHRAMDNAGAVIGPLVAALLLGFAMPVRHIFMWTLVPALLCLVMALLLKEPPATPRPVAAPARGRLSELPKGYHRFLIAVGLFSLGNSSNLFLLWRARELGIADQHIPLLWAGISAITMLAVAPLSALSDRLGRRTLLVGGYLAYAVVYASIGQLTAGGARLLILFGLFGLVLAASEGVERAVVADLVPPERRGSAYGWFHLTLGATLLPASVGFGWLYEVASPAVAFSTAASAALAGALLMLWWVPFERPETTP